MATRDSVDEALCHARSIDIAEVYQGWGINIRSDKSAKSAIFETPGSCFVAYSNADPLAIFGIAPGQTIVAPRQPWMIGTKFIKIRQRDFLQGSRQYLELLTERGEPLKNYVMRGNEGAIRWLRWLGFTIHDAVPFGPFGTLFHPFTRNC